MPADSDVQVQDYFKAGGTLLSGAPSYVKRPADDELLGQVLAGQFCYVLTPRQMGKSSLMIRTAERLRAEGVRVSIVDLSVLGTQLTADQWYLGIIWRLATDLSLGTDVETWWHEQGQIGPVQKFTDFLCDILAQIPERIAIFVDEIDYTWSLAFTDDFFAAIRVVFNRRANHPEYDRLTFVLLGVVAPTDLIKDRNRTPFNIGRAIDLREFNRADAQVLEEGLERFRPGQGALILDRVFYWTAGHPYLTQKLCAAATTSGTGHGNPNTLVDEQVSNLFLAGDLRKDEGNLNFVRSNIEASPECRALLQVYRRVYRGEAIPEDRRSPLQARLRLIGLVSPEGGVLAVRNRIYYQVFDLKWIQANTPVQWGHIATVMSVIISVIALIAAVLIIRAQQENRISVEISTHEESFWRNDDPDRRTYRLAEICRRRPAEARRFFFDDKVDRRTRSALFMGMLENGNRPEVKLVVDCLLPGLEQKLATDPTEGPVADALCCALARLDFADGRDICMRLGRPYGCGPH